MSVPVHHSIAEFLRSINEPVEEDTGFAIHDLTKIHYTYPYQSPVYRADYFSFLFIKDGMGSYTIDTHEFPFESRTVYFTNPGHVKSWTTEYCNSGYIITMNEHFLRENVHPDVFGEFSFLLAEIVSPKVLDQEGFAELEEIYMQIERESKGESSYKNKILGNLFVVLLLKIKERFWQNYCPLDEGGRDSEIVKSFKQSMERQFKGLTSEDGIYQFHLQDYADELNLHPNYLNNVIKSKTGKTVSEMINKRMTTTAKVMLKNSGYSAKEVAHRLGFSQPTHFSRFFKKQTGQTPLDFKRSVA